MLTAIDLFCGAGGSTTGLHMAGVEVVACINHDKTAILSHLANYPSCQHYMEDIRLFDEKILPQVDIITMSAECTHFSNAKGGDSRDADSRTLSEELFRYIEWTNPRIIVVENVKEFMTWGPLKQKIDGSGNPIYKNDGRPFLIPDTDENNLGIFYQKWVKKIKGMGYEYKSSILNSADFGAYTSRERFFGVFVKKGYSLSFPTPTHSKHGMPLQKWKACKNLLRLENKGRSIFGRKTPLSDNTYRRIYNGLLKFVTCSHNRLKESATVRFICQYNGASTMPYSVDSPLNTITTKDRFALVSVELEDDPSRGSSINGLLEDFQMPLFSDVYGEESNCLNDMVGVLPSRVLKRPEMEIQDDDPPHLRKIKMLAEEFGIRDISTRFLDVSELIDIQGFPKGYRLEGGSAKQKQMIGNSVVPVLMQKIIERLISVNRRLLRLNDF